MRKYFFTGFVTLLPLTLTIVIGLWLFDLFTAPLAGIMESLLLTYENNLGLSLQHHETLVIVLSRILAFCLLFLMILVLGICGQKFLNTFFLNILDRFFSKVPFIRTIYRLSHDLTHAVFSDSKKTFKETVLLPFPHKDALAIGFVTGETPELFKREGIPLTEQTVFVPTSPHPMSGFVLLTPKQLTFPVDVSIEDAFKFLISCGVIHPSKEESSDPSHR